MSVIHAGIVLVTQEGQGGKEAVEVASVSDFQLQADGGIEAD